MKRIGTPTLKPVFFKSRHEHTCHSLYTFLSVRLLIKKKIHSYSHTSILTKASSWFVHILTKEQECARSGLNARAQRGWVNSSLLPP